MKSLSVKMRLMLVIGMMALMLVATAVISLFDLNSANGRLESFVNGVNARAHLASEIRNAVNRRAVAARNLVLVKSADDIAKEKAAVTQAHHDVTEYLAKLKSAVSDPAIPDDVRAKVADIESIEKQYGPVATHIVDLALSGDHEAAIADMNDKCRPLLAALLQSVTSYLTLTDERSKLLIEQAESEFSRQRNTLIAVCLLALFAAAAMGWSLVRYLQGALGTEPSTLNAVALRVASGDLSPIDKQADAHRHSVLAMLGVMQQNLSDIVGQVRHTSDSIATGSAQIAAGNADLSHRTESQAASLQETSASMAEIQSTVVQNAQTAKQATELASSASQAAVNGGEVMRDMIATMQQISDSSQKVADIISVIDGIAFQTNILALNAAVEAARAGEQGRGFAVVAGEVRTLAQRSAEAAKEIKTLINDSVSKVESGTQLVGNAGTVIESIVGQVQQVADFIADISATAGEQTSAIGQVTQSIGHLDQATQQNAALVEESAAAAESLRNQAALLTNLVGKFKTGQAAMLG